MKKLFFYLAIFTSPSLIAQNVGIGITTPLAPLHISAGASGNLTPFSPLVVEGSNNTYINILSPNNKETGLLFGKADNAASGAIVYNNVNALNGFQFRTAGNITQMILNNTGNLGIGLATPNAKLSISANGTELTGTAAGNTLRTNAGVLGSTAGNELSLANIGFLSGNNSSLGIRAYRSSAGTDWTNTALLIGYDVDNTVRASTGFLALSANGNMGINTVTPHASALLDVTSTTKGMLPPRMTTVQRDAIVNPSPGLMLFNTTTQSLEVFTTYGWYGLQVQLPERKLLGGPGLDEAYSMQQTADGGYIIAGNSYSSASGDVTGNNNGVSGTSDYWVVKLDASRNIVWNKLLGGSQDDFGKSIQQTTDGGYIVAGYSRSSANGNVSETNHGSSDYWIVKLDGSGNIQWNRLIGGSSGDEAQSVKQTTDGGYIVAGYSLSSANGDVTGTNHGSYDYWIVKLDGSGNIMWNRLLGGTLVDQAYDIVQAADGNFVVTGQSSSSANGDVTSANHGGVDYWIVRLDISGATILWNKLLGGTGDERAQSIRQTTDDGYIVAGHSTSSANGDVTSANHGGYDYWIVKLDRFGNITWNKLIGGDGDDQSFNIKQTIDGGYIVAGYSRSSGNGDVTGVNHGTSDYWIVKFDGTGNIIWNRLIGGTANEEAKSVYQTADGGYVVAGFTYSSFNGDVTGGNHGIDDFWLIKLTSIGFLN